MCNTCWPRETWSASLTTPQTLRKISFSGCAASTSATNGLTRLISIAANPPPSSCNRTFICSLSSVQVRIADSGRSTEQNLTNTHDVNTTEESAASPRLAGIPRCQPPSFLVLSSHAGVCRGGVSGRSLIPNIQFLVKTRKHPQGGVNEKDFRWLCGNGAYVSDAHICKFRWR